MKKKYIFLIILIVFTTFTIIVILFVKTVFSGLGGIGNSSGGYHSSTPYFITTEPTIVKRISVPKGTKLTYLEGPFAEGKQNKMLDEEYLKTMTLPEDKTIDWGGVPVNEFKSFGGDFNNNSNSEGLLICSNLNALSDGKKIKIDETLGNCNNELSVLIENKNDWTFNLKNIIKMESCGINIQHYFKKDKRKQ